jgi:hypothetical protein
MKKKFIKIIMLLIIVPTVGCSHYSTTGKRPETENIINAPIDIVWEKTLQILPTERITVKVANKDTYFIQGYKGITFWSLGDEINIKLFPKGDKQTIVHFGAETAAPTQFVGWGHQERMVKKIFNRIKSASEAQ